MSLKQTPFSILALILSIVFSPRAMSGVADTRLTPRPPVVQVCFTNLGRLAKVVPAVWDGAKKPIIRSQSAHAAIIGREFTDTEKKIIQIALDREYTQDRTGIEFDGFKDCPTAAIPKGTIIVAPVVIGIGEGYTVIQENYTGVALRPFVSLEQAGELPEKFSSRPFSMTVQLDEVALHEFGHVAGLRHENEKNFMPEFVAYTRPDPNSLLNPRYLFEEAFLRGLPMGARHFSLSPGDLHTLKCIHRARTKIDASDCREDFDPDFRKR